MATIKISALTPININANTSNTYIVAHDASSGVSGRLTATSLASGLYANNILNVGNNSVILPNVVSQFAGTGDSYVQTNLVNINNGGSADYVVTANTGSDTTYFVDMGFANKDFVPGSEYNSLGNSLSALDGYIYVQGNSSALNVGGNLIIGTTTSQTETRFIVGGGTSENVVTKMSATQISFNRQIRFGDGTTQNTSPIAAGLYANGAFVQANAAYTQANAAFTKANNALANTSGTFDGNLTISGNVTVTGQTSSTGPITTGNLIVAGTSTLTGNVVINATTYLTGAVTVNSTMLLANSNFSATEAALTISASPSVVTPANDGYMIHISGKNGVASRIVTDSYGTGAYALYTGRAARGTVTSPTAIQANDVIARYSSSGYGTTKYQSLGTGRIDFVANENYTDANTGSRIEFWNCPTGSNTLNRIATFNGESVNFSGSVEPMKGFVYTPRILSGAQTAITIDFSSDSIVRATFNSTLTISLSNYKYGKIVDVWVTNTAGNGQTINLGALANNITTGSTTLSVASGRSAKLQYFSIDGDQANTFVAVTYA